MYCYTLLVATGTLVWLAGGGAPNLPFFVPGYFKHVLFYAAIASFFTAQSARACTTPYQALIKGPNLSIARQAVDAAGLKGTTIMCVVEWYTNECM